MSMLGYFDLAFALLAAGAASFAVALTLLGSVMTWSSSMTSRTEVMFGHTVWTCIALGCALVAAACIVVLITPL